MPFEPNAVGDMSAQPAPQGLGRKHLPVLDGIRGAAILSVLVYHFGGQFRDKVSGTADEIFIRFLQSGWIGVDLFFVLSGFLITGILVDTRMSRNYFSSFYCRRVLRIFPAYYATLFVLLVLVPSVALRLPASFGEMSRKMLEHQAAFWTFSVNWLLAVRGSDYEPIPGSYFWSLAVEEQFYIVWPVVVLVLGSETLRKVIWLLLPAVLLSRILLLGFGFAPESLYYATLTHLDGMLAGALIAVFVRTPGVEHIPGRRFASVAAASCLALAGIGIWQGHFYFWDEWPAAVGLSLLAICFAYLLLATITAAPDAPLVRIFNNPVLRSFGKYSYSIYLLHIPIGLVLHKLIAPERFSVGGTHVPVILAMILIGSTVSWLAGLLSWHLFEKHFLKLKSFFEYDTESIAAPAQSLCRSPFFRPRTTPADKRSLIVAAPHQVTPKSNETHGHG